MAMSDRAKLREIIMRHAHGASAAKYFGVSDASYLHKKLWSAADGAAEEIASESGEPLRGIGSLTEDECVEISRIFYPGDNYRLSFASSWPHTRENIGRRIASNDFPVAFPIERYFALYKYLTSKGIEL